MEKFIVFIFLAVIGNFVLCSPYAGHKVFKVYPDTVKNVSSIASLKSNLGIDFWDSISTSSHGTRVMVSPEQMDTVKKLFLSLGVRNEIIAEDVPKYKLIFIVSYCVHMKYLFQTACRRKTKKRGTSTY